MLLYLCTSFVYCGCFITDRVEIVDRVGLGLVDRVLEIRLHFRYLSKYAVVVTALYDFGVFRSRSGRVEFVNACQILCQVRALRVRSGHVGSWLKWWGQGHAHYGSLLLNVCL